MAAALQVTEPNSTGLGGDCFLLYYEASTKQVHALNGSGKSPHLLMFEEAQATVALHSKHVNAVTVPGACAAWCDAVQAFGSMTMKQVLEPAVQLAQDGFPVSSICSHFWNNQQSLLLGTPNGTEMLVNGTHAPQPGEYFSNANLALVLKDIQQGGKKAFYEGRVGKEIVQVIQSLGGKMTMEDLASHASIIEPSISTTYKGYTLHEVGPNSQGIVALMALNILEHVEMSKMQHNSEEYTHVLIEALRLAFADARKYVTDPSVCNSEMVISMLSKAYAKQRASLIGTHSNKNIKFGVPLAKSDTVYFCCVDAKGNACSMVNSNYEGFGTGIVPKGCGFTLQNRGSNFVFDTSTDFNSYAPGKRPYHTIIPAMCTKNGELYCAYGIMGGFNQPQAHVQVLLNMIQFGMNPQLALNVPRFCIAHDKDDYIYLEEGFADDVVQALQAKNHTVHVLHNWERSLFGRGQVIQQLPNHVYCAGSDKRADGMAIPLL